jgi:hypothetical protein
MTLGMYTNPNLHFPPSMDDGCVKVAPPLDVFEEGCKHWQSTLVDHFMGHKLLYPIVNFIVNKIWGSYRLSKVLSSKNGFFLFIFY